MPSEVSIAIFENSFKNNDKQPDYVIYCNQKKVGALWKRKTKAGQKMLGGLINADSVKNAQIFQMLEDAPEDKKILVSEMLNEPTIEETVQTEDKVVGE